MGAERLAISVEHHCPEFGASLEAGRLHYNVVRSSRRWVYLTEYLPSPVAEATARFLQRNILPEMLLNHLDSTYDDLPEEDRLAVFQDNLDYLQHKTVTRGTQALIQPSLEELKGLSIQGWLRFRGEVLLNHLIAQLACEGLRELRLERAYQQFRTLGTHNLEHLVIEGEGGALVIKDRSGIELFREYMHGYLDPRLKIDREDLACGLVKALRPAQVELVNVTPGLRRRIEEIL